MNIEPLPKNSREQVRFSFTEYKGHDLLDIRVYYNDGLTEENWKPSKKGITLSRELLPEFAEKVQALLEAYQNETPAETLEGS